MRLDGKVAIITGAASGIGKEITFAREGAGGELRLVHAIGAHSPSALAQMLRKTSRTRTMKRD